MAKCRWLKTKGQITGAKTESGERSSLFDNLTNKFGSEKAQELYAVANSDEFLNIYNSSEQTLEDVVSFVAEQNENKQPLNTDQRVDLQNFLLGVDNFDVSAFYSEGLFTISAEKLKIAGYNAYEIEKLKSDLDLQEQVKNAVESLKNTPNLELTSTPFENLEKTSEITSFGKMTNVNPFVVEKNVLEALAGETENFDELYNQLEYTNLNKEELRQEVKKYQKVEEYKEVDGQISPRKITETESIIPLVVTDNSAIPMMQNLQGLAVIRLDVLQENSETTYRALDKLEDQLITEGFDVIGLADKPIDENLLSFLSDLNTFLMNPTRENTKMYADVSDAYFQRDLSPKISAIKKIKENKDYVKLNTTLNEEQVYEQQGLIKVEDGLYIKTAKQPLEELYSVLEQYPDKIPQGKTLEKYIQEQIGEYDDFTNAENAEAVTLYKMYFDVANDAVNEVRNSKGELLAPNGKVSNLNEEQYKLVRTPEFKAWFGDWQNAPQNASKVVDENGEPMIVNHNTNRDFFTFKDRPQYFFSKDEINEFGDINMKTFLNIRTPLIIPDAGSWANIDFKISQKNIYDELILKYQEDGIPIEAVGEWARKNNYDGVFALDILELEDASIETDDYIALNSNQIKSATEIKGTVLTDTNDIRYLKSITPTLKGQNFTGDFDYLTNEYVSDFYIDYLREKKKNSKKFKNFYSNFTVNEKGIQLVNDDEITLSVVKQYADENLKQYSLISKQMPNLIEDESVVSNKRDEYINYPQNAPKFEGQSYLLPNDVGMIAKDTTEDFLRVGRDVFELQDTDGNISLYSKLEQNNSDYYKFGTEKTENKVNIAGYSHLKTELDNFSKTKKYLKEDIRDFDC